ncbi:hypothetical protein Tsubulata_026532, partial [Turnera subulata]
TTILLCIPPQPFLQQFHKDHPPPRLQHPRLFYITSLTTLSHMHKHRRLEDLSTMQT